MQGPLIGLWERFTVVYLMATVFPTFHFTSSSPIPLCLHRFRGQRAAGEAEGDAPAQVASSSPSATAASRHQPQLLSQLHLLILRAASAPVAPLPCRTHPKPHDAFETDTLLKSQWCVDGSFLRSPPRICSSQMYHFVLLVLDLRFELLN